MSGKQPTLILSKQFDLDYVEGSKGEKTDDVYDDSVDVYIEHGSVGQPCVTLRFCPSGPSEFVILGWGTDAIRQLAAFLTSAADAIDEEVAKQ